jgi:hypothetical protein
MADDLTLTTVSDDTGRTLSGVGVTADDLQATVDAHEPAPPADQTAPVAGASAAASSPPEPPQLAKGRARYSALTHDRDTEKARADAAEKKAAELEARLSTTPSTVAQAQPAEQASASRVQPPPAQPPATRPEPTEDEVGTTYPTYGAFVAAHGAWVWDQQQATIDQRIQQGIASHQQQQAFQAHVESTRAKGRAAYADFDQMLTNGPGTFINMPMPAVQAILNAPNSEHLQYQIMKDGALAQRLAGLAFQDPFAFAVELARLVPPPTPVASNGNGQPPPAPMQPVGSSSKSTTTNFADYAEKGDYQGYKAARAADRKRGSR